MGEIPPWTSQKGPHRKHNASAVRVGHSTVKKLGLPRVNWADPYHLLLTMPWPQFLALICVAYLFANVLFALAYLAGGNDIVNARPGSFIDAFFFSTQTMATIGYCEMAPRTTYAHILTIVQALAGLLGFAIATGLMFARFSRPTARVIFSRTSGHPAVRRRPHLDVQIGQPAPQQDTGSTGTSKPAARRTDRGGRHDAPVS